VSTVAVTRPAARASWPLDLGRAALAAGALSVSGLPGGAWWAAVVAGALLWPLLARASARRGAVLAGVALLPVPAFGYEGLRVYDPPAWWVVSLGVAAAYGLVGGLGAELGARVWPEAGVAWRPLAWLWAWFGLDLLLSHGSGWPLPFPVTPGYALIGGPFAVLAAIGGAAGLGLTWTVLGCAAATLLPRGVGWGRTGAVAWCLPALLLTLVAAALQARVDGVDLGEPRTVGVVQLPGAIAAPAADTTRPRPADAERLLAYAARAAPLAADLHVWPEAALGTALVGGLEPLARVARTLGAPVLAGAFRLADDGTWRNAVAFADPRGATFAVDKRMLVPGYEAWLTPGVGERWPLWAAGWRIGVLVCWESLFLDAAADRVRNGADLLAVVAHDGWAAGTGTPRWHARAARLLAYAVGRPVVFASHDGPSMAWGHDGRLLLEVASGPAALTVAVAAPLDWRTPYLRLGLGGLTALWLTAGALGALLASWGARRGRARGQGCGASGPQAP
jgi:apolipoprotein N-acyltransferase